MYCGKVRGNFFTSERSISMPQGIREDFLFLFRLLMVPFMYTHYLTHSSLSHMVVFQKTKLINNKAVAIVKRTVQQRLKLSRCAFEKTDFFLFLSNLICRRIVKDDIVNLKTSLVKKFWKETFRATLECAPRNLQP